MDVGTAIGRLQATETLPLQILSMNYPVCNMPFLLQIAAIYDTIHLSILNKREINMQDIGMQFHIRCTEGDVGRYVFLPGDPGRCEAIAKHFDNPVHIGMNREYNIWNGTLLGEKVTVSVKQTLGDGK